MKIGDFIAGKCYQYAKLEGVEGVTMQKYGSSSNGKSAVHLEDESLDYDVWFIYDGWVSQGGIFKCVYAN